MALQQDIVLACGFEEVKTTIFRKSTLDKGKNLVVANHVGKVREQKTFRSREQEQTNQGTKPTCHRVLTASKSVITADVIPQTSVSKLYHVTLTVNEERDIVEKFCTCKVGRDVCKHQAAVCVFVNNDPASQTKTSKPQTWDKPSVKSNDYKRGKRATDFCQNSVLNLCKPIMKEPPINILPNINSINCPLTKMLQAESRDYEDLTVRSLLKEVVDRVVLERAKDTAISIIFDWPEYQNCEVYIVTEPVYRRSSKSKKIIMDIPSVINDRDVFKFYEEHVCVDICKAKEIFVSTVDQSKSKLWKQERLPRITSTKAGKVKTRKSNFEELALSLLEDVNLNVPAVRYGSKMEPQAKRRYTQDTEENIELLESGLVVSHLQPWLACSPDALIVPISNLTSEGVKLLEVKCPFSCKRKPILDYESKLSNVPYLYFKGDEPKLKEKHLYYTQIQIAMYVTGINVCDLYVYSPCQSVVIKVIKDNDFLSQTIPKIETFYFKYYLPLAKAKMSPVVN